MFRAKRLDPEYRDTVRPTPEAAPAITRIVIHLPPGMANSGSPLVVDGAARMIPPDQDTEASGAESSSEE